MLPDARPNLIPAAALAYDTPLAPGEIRRQLTSEGIRILVGPRTVGQVVASCQWLMIWMALVMGGSLASLGFFAAVLLLGRVRTADEGAMAMGVAVTGLSVGILAWSMLHLYRRRTRPTVFLIDPVNFFVDPEDERYMFIGVPRAKVAAVEVVRLRARAFAPAPAALKVYLHGSPPLVALSGLDLTVVSQAATEVKAALASAGVGAIPVAPLTTNLLAPLVPYERLPLTAAPHRNEAAQPADVLTEVQPDAVLIVVPRATLRHVWRAVAGPLLVLGATSSLMVAFAAAAASGAGTRRSSYEDNLVATLVILLVPWCWSLWFACQGWLNQRRRAVFVVGRHELELPGPGVLSGQVRLPRVRVTDVSVGQRRGSYWGPRHVLMIELDGHFPMYVLPGREPDLLMRVARQLRSALGMEAPAVQSLADGPARPDEPAAG